MLQNKAQTIGDQRSDHTANSVPSLAMAETTPRESRVGAGTVGDETFRIADHCQPDVSHRDVPPSDRRSIAG